MEAPPSHLDWSVLRVRAAPSACGLVKAIARKGVRATAGEHPGGLIGQMLGRIRQFSLQRDLVPYVLAVLDLVDFPGAESHRSSYLRPKSTRCQIGIPVTRVTIARDKKPD